MFPADPEEREEEMKKIASERDKLFMQIREEKRLKEEKRLRAEQKSKKALYDLERSLGTLQLVKGVLTFNRLKNLKSVFQFCKDSIAHAKMRDVLAVPLEVVELIGRNAFPEKTVNDSLRAAGKLPLVTTAVEPVVESNIPQTIKEEPEKSPTDLDDDDYPEDEPLPPPNYIGYSGGFRVPIGEAPGIIAMMRETVVFGRGLCGVAYRDAVELLQAYAVTRLTAFYRGYKLRWRYRLARKFWKQRYQLIKILCYRDWAEWTKYKIELRNRCLRKVKAWRFYQLKAKARREFFRCCYWPYFVWRRFAFTTKTAREKVKFLTSRVLPTYNTMKIFRAWRSYTAAEGVINRTAETFLHSRLMTQAKICFTWYKRWTFRRRQLRHSWVMEGLRMLQRILTFCKVYPFFVWKAYVAYKKAVSARSSSLASVVRAFFMPKVQIFKVLSYTILFFH